MPLESLSDEQINIHDLTLEQEKKPELESWKLYESLKKSAFYDPRKEKWNALLDNDQTIQKVDNIIYYSEDQLIATLVEVGYDKNEGIEIYEKFKSTPFFDSDKKQWRAVDNPELIGYDYHCTIDQLLDILITTNFDKAKAVELYDNLEALTFNNKGKEVGRLVGSEIPSGDEYKSMLRILIELRTGRLIDSARTQDLISRIKAAQKAYSTKSILFSVLIESQVNRALAEDRFEHLKETPLYEPEKKLWKQQIRPQVKAAPRFDIIDQFVGLLCEQEFEKKEPNLQTPTPSLPETRSY